MTKYVHMAHGISFDLNKVKWYRVRFGESWQQEYWDHCNTIDPDMNLPIGHSRSDRIRFDEAAKVEEEKWRRRMPMVLELCFIDGERLVIPEFDHWYITDVLLPAIEEIEKDIPEKTDPKKEEGSVYLIQGETTKRIKIGWSKNVEKRIKALESSEKLRLLYEIIGVTKDDEKALHTLFQDYRIKDEWFEPHKLILEYISFLQRFEIKGEVLSNTWFNIPDDEWNLTELKKDKLKSISAKSLASE